MPIRVRDFVAGLVAAAVVSPGVASAQLLKPTPNPPGPATSLPSPPALVDSKGKFVGYIQTVFLGPMANTQVVLSLNKIWGLAVLDATNENITGPFPTVIWTGANCSGKPYLVADNQASSSIMPWVTIGIPPGQSGLMVYYADTTREIEKNVNFASGYVPTVDNPPYPIPVQLKCVNATFSINAAQALSMPASSLGWTPPFRVGPAK